MLNGVKAKIENLDHKASSSERMLRGMYDKFNQEYQTYTAHLKKVEWGLQQLSESCFKLQAHEEFINAVESVWTKDGKEDKNDPKGILYLSDQRLLFEQKEEVATKKVLFVTTERKMVQELLFEIPVSMLEKIEATEQGLFKNQDFLDILLSPGAPFARVQLHLFGQNSSDWKAMINALQAGEYDKNRTRTLEPEILEKIKNAPTVCPNCNGAITQPILRGMQQLTCEFCGSVIKL